MFSTDTTSGALRKSISGNRGPDILLRSTMPRKTPTTQRQVIVVNATPLDDDEADSLISRERERTDLVIPFEEFLKRHPRDVGKFTKRNGRQPSPGWKSQLLGGAEHEYAG